VCTCGAAGQPGELRLLCPCRIDWQFLSACLSIFEILASQVLEESQRYPWSPVYRRAVLAKGKLVESNRSKAEQKDLP
jgi:hypothetical protein